MFNSCLKYLFGGYSSQSSDMIHSSNMNLNKILLYSIIAGIFLVPFVVFLVPTNMFFPFITGKNFTFRIIVEILLGLYMALAIRDASYRPRFSLLLGVFAVFIVIIGAADLLSENPFKSFWSNFERMEGYITFLHLFAYFLVTSALLNSEKLWERLFQTTLGASLLMSFYAILQHFGVFAIHQGSTRVDASLGNATYLAIYVVLHLFLALFLFFRHQGSKGWKIFYVVSFLLNLFVLYSTETRGAILGFVGGVFLIALILAVFERENKKLRKTAIIGVTGILILIGLFLAFKNTPFVQGSSTLSRIANISISGASADPRFMIWGVAFEGFKERPILGWGQESFNYVFNKYYDPKLYGQEQWFDRTHNVILDWLIAGGILGLFGYLSLYLLALFYIWKKGEFTFKEKAVLTGMFAAYFFHNLFVFDNLISLILFTTFLSYLHSHATRNREVSVSSPAPAWLSVSSLPVLGVSALVLVYVFNWGPIMANTSLIKALTAVSTPTGQGPALFNKALAYNSFGNQEIREQLMQYAVGIRSIQGIPDATKQETVEFTVSEMKKMIEEAPNDVRHYLFLGTVLDTYGAYDEAEKILTKALELSPKKQSILFQVATHYLNTGNTDKALELFKQAYESAPKYNEARLIYAMGAIYAGKNNLAETLLGKEVVLDDRLLRAYVETKQFEKAIAIVKAKVALNPADLNTQLSLAAVYYQAGQRGNSIAVIQQMMVNNPDFKQQGEAYIKQIQEGTI